MDEADGVAPQITATEAEAYIEALEPLPLESYASPKWYRQHEYLEKLNLQAHHNIIHRGDEFVYEALCDLDKIPIVIHELIAAEVWKTKVHVSGGCRVLLRRVCCAVSAAVAPAVLHC